MCVPSALKFKIAALLFTEYMFRLILRILTDYIPEIVGLCNADALCFLWDRNWIFKCCLFRRVRTGHELGVFGNRLLRRIFGAEKEEVSGTGDTCRLGSFVIRFNQALYTGCPRRNVRDFERVFLMLNYTDITQNTYIQSWTVTEILAIEKCGHVGCPRTVRRRWRHTRTLRMPGN